MSLIRTNGSNVRVTVVIRTMGRNPRNQPEAVEVGRVPCSGRIAPSTDMDVERYAGSGEAVMELVRFITPAFPGDDMSQVITPDGRVWEVQGVVDRIRSSRATSRDIVVLSAKAQTRRW